MFTIRPCRIKYVDMSVSSLGLLLTLRGCGELRPVLLKLLVKAFVVIMFLVLEVIVIFISAVVDFILRDIVVIGHATALAVECKREWVLEVLLIRLGTVVVDNLLLAFSTSGPDFGVGSLDGGLYILSGLCGSLFSQALGSGEGCCVVHYSRASTIDGRGALFMARGDETSGGWNSELARQDTGVGLLDLIIAVVVDDDNVGSSNAG
jgi:hypothetical protein